MPQEHHGVGRTVAVMQPYFCPYIGYFQLINAVDLFVIYDNIQYAKKGWINRNRILQQGKAASISIALKHDSDFWDIRDRAVADSFDRERLLRRIAEAYRRAPQFDRVLPLMTEVIRFRVPNLFEYLHHALVVVCRYLGIRTPMVVSSTLAIDRALRAQDRVIATCQALDATRYVNPIGGRVLYSEASFRAQGIELRFLRPREFRYQQYGGEFVPWLSVIDVMMFNSVNEIRDSLERNYDLISSSEAMQAAVGLPDLLLADDVG